MIDSEKPLVVQLVAKTLALYGRPLPDKAMMSAWLEGLASYPMNVIDAALKAYCAECGEFAPVPAGIAMRCKQMDGRPGVEEAWAMSIVSQDEAQTVVWTSEMSEAFFICKPILDTCDDVAARMTFKEAYTRLVSTARARAIPVKWTPSLGTDPSNRKTALNAAVAQGLLPAPVVAGLLPPPSLPKDSTDTSARATLATIKHMLATTSDAAQKKREVALQQERDAVAARKQTLKAQMIKAHCGKTVLT